MYSTWRIVELKAELKRRGAPLRGRKADLVERLEAYDRNFNFENIEVISPEPQMVLPPAELYRDVNSDASLPPLSKQHIHFYFSRFNKNTIDGLHLYESRYLLILRLCKVEDEYYFKGYCKASMKKLQYEVNIKINHSGEIQESNCECIVGTGVEAHCKHVAVVAFAVEHMVRENKLLLFEVSTQKLQTFHQPRKIFTASPKKVNYLPTKRKKPIVFDPYPFHLVDKTSFNNRVRNICIGALTSTMPIKHLYGPGNPYALMLDHDYLKDNMTDILLQNLFLMKVSKEKLYEIEEETRGQSNNPKWHEWRQNRITASRFHTVCHLKLQTQKTFVKQLLYPTTFTSRATTHGLINESVALKAYMEKYGLEVHDSGLIISESHPYLGASPDGLLGEETVIEIKCPYASRYQNIDHNTISYLCVQNGDLVLDNTSPCYYQIQGQLFCTNRRFCNLIIYTFNDLKVIYVHRDEIFINNMVMKLSACFENCLKPALINKYIIRNYK